MTTVVLVHGIGVREGAYLQMFDRFRTQLARVRPGVAVQPCQWGDDLGATLRGGMSVPGYEARATPERAAEDEWGVARWRLLAADPLHELRVLAVLGDDRGASPFDVGGQNGTAVVERAGRLADDPEVSALLVQWGLDRAFRTAVPEVMRSAAAVAAMRLAEPPDLAPAVSRALIAASLAADPAVPLIAERREHLHRLLVDRLGGADLGGMLANRVKPAAMLAWRWIGAGMVERRRSAIHDSANPFAGDVMYYLSRGERIREFVRDCIQAGPAPVVVVAHSLGGIAAVDLLSTLPLPEVAHLVTVGSQAPFLYEIDALPSLSYGQELPASVPAWTNVYDHRDLLSFVGAGVFPGRVTDVEVPSGNPFPDAHSDYFGNPGFYRVLGDVLTEVSG